MNFHENFIIDQQLSYSLTTIESAVCLPTFGGHFGGRQTGSCSSILPAKQYHIIIVDNNIITVSALSMDCIWS